jgi:hypothetical protein
MNLANYEGLALIAATLPQFDFHWASKAEGQSECPTLLSCSCARQRRRAPPPPPLVS